MTRRSTARSRSNRSTLLKRLAVSALGLGYLPLAPGTWASAGAVAAVFLLHPSALVLAFALVLVLLVGLALAPWAEVHYGKKDPRHFVLDEVAGMWFTLSIIEGLGPELVVQGRPTAIALAFVAFRVFDVLKPFPIRRIERLPGGWGIMLDDLAAAVYAAGLVWVVSWLAWMR